MKRTFIISLVAILLVGTQHLHAQIPGDEDNGIAVENLSVKKRGRNLVLSMTITLNRLKVGKNEQIVLIPALRSNNDPNIEQRFPTVVVAGRKRHNMIVRGNALNRRLFKEEPEIITRRKNGTAQRVNYEASIPYRDWMAEVSLFLREEVSGCANCNLDYRSRKLPLTYYSTVTHDKEEYTKNESGDRSADTTFEVRIVDKAKLTFKLSAIQPNLPDELPDQEEMDRLKWMMENNPAQLSLEEMLLLSSLYDVNSQEFDDIFQQIAICYPENETVVLNVAAAEIAAGNYDKAIIQLEAMEENPIVWNNMGVAYALKKDYVNAKLYFIKAEERGDAQAKENLETLQEIERLKQQRK
jgi:tetratricopeptide (TPR) repeat protein